MENAEEESIETGGFKAELFEAIFNGSLAEIENVLASHEHAIPIKDVSFKCFSPRSNPDCGCLLFYKKAHDGYISPYQVETYMNLVRRGKCTCLPCTTDPDDIKETLFYPIHLIVFRNHIRLFPFFLQNGCDINARDGDNETALELAIKSSVRIDCVKELLKHNADLTGEIPLLKLALDSHDLDSIEPLVAAGCNINEIYPNGNTLLYEAVMMLLSQDLVRNLIRLGADVNVNNRTAHKCLGKAIRWRDEELLRFLLIHGCNVDATPEDVPDSLTAIQNTVCQGLTKMTEMLIKAGCDVNKTTNDIPAPLSLAAGDGRVKEVQMLLDAGANVNQTQEQQYTAMHFAAWDGRDDVVKILLEAGAEYKNPTRDRNTPLALACHGGYPDVIERLLQIDKNVNNADKDLDCPLHYTAFNSDFRSSYLLIQEGADPHVENNLRVTPVWNAVYRNCSDCVLLFIKCNVDVSVPSVGIDQEANSDHPIQVYQKPRTPLQIAILKNYEKVAKYLALQMKLQDMVEEVNYLIRIECQEELLDEPEEVMQWYLQFTSQPSTLLFICNRAIRQILGKRIFESVDCLDIPEVLKKYLTFSHIKLPQV